MFSCVRETSLTDYFGKMRGPKKKSHRLNAPSIMKRGAISNSGEVGALAVVHTKLTSRQWQTTPQVAGNNLQSEDE